MTDNEDVVIRGRLVCAATGRDERGAVAIRGDRIVALGERVNPAARQIIELGDDWLVPGLIDLHAHPARDGSVFGVDPDAAMLARGTTTVLSQGDAGAANIDAYVRETIQTCRTRVRLAINLSRVGESTARGCLERLEDADVDACVAAISRHSESIWGIAVNASRHACSTTDPREVLRRGLAVANETGRPLLYGMRPEEDWPLAEQLALLRRGDVVTYCFRRRPHCIVDWSSSPPRVFPAIHEARRRGILFDVGHGTASFSFDVAAAALADGFPPDTISTDLQAGHGGIQPVHDLPAVLAKLEAAGMGRLEVLAAATARPARILGLEQTVGALAVGHTADLTALRIHPEQSLLADTDRVTRRGHRWECTGVIRAGRLIRGLDNKS